MDIIATGATPDQIREAVRRLEKRFYRSDNTITAKLVLSSAIPPGHEVVGPDRLAVDAACRRFARATRAFSEAEEDSTFETYIALESERNESWRDVLALDPTQLGD